MPELAKTEVTLLNCDAEPIHIPGSIQAHGCLLTVDHQGVIRNVSANSIDWWGRTIQPGELWRDVLSPHASMGDALEKAGLDLAKKTTHGRIHIQIPIAGHQADAVMTHVAGGMLLELEPAPPSADTHAAMMALHQGMADLPHLDNTVLLLQHIADTVRSVTGFDRVMAYRFRHDDSGEVVGESRVEHLDAYLGRTYPASDIPAQARRLYTVKLLRGIADVSAVPVAVLGLPQDAPLDMSHGELRSVSPIHVEYLQNMGVGASLSISLVVKGRLWGLIACHHMGPKLIAFEIRRALELLSQVVSARIEQLDREAKKSRLTSLASMRARLSLSLAQTSDTVQVLTRHFPWWLKTWDAQAAVIVEDDKVAFSDPSLASGWPDVAAWLGHQPSSMISVHRGQDWPGEAMGMAGVLAIRFSDVQFAWVCLFRQEQVQTIRWGGKPEKVVKVGPNGPRLTPRGSFEEWQQEVHNTCVPWQAIEIEMADEMRQTLHRVHAERHLSRMDSRPSPVLNEWLEMQATEVRHAVPTFRLGKQEGTLEDGVSLLKHPWMPKLLQTLLPVMAQASTGPIDLYWGRSSLECWMTLSTQVSSDWPAIASQMTLLQSLCKTAGGELLIHNHQGAAVINCRWRDCE